MARWLLLGCIGKAVAYHGGKGLLNYLGGLGLGDVLFEALPDVARDAHGCLSKRKDAAGRLAELESLAQAPFPEVRQEALRVAQNVAPDQPPEAQEALAAYLAQVPSTIRRSLRRPSDPTGRTVPPGLALHRADDLLAFLPARMPRFRPGDCPLPGLDLVLEQMLGMGGFGEVWRARNPHLSSAPPVALKLCLDELAARELRNESALLDRVMQHGRHSGIVQLRQTYLGAPTPFLEYELVEGGDLAGLLGEWQRRTGGPTPEQAARVILRLAETVGSVHRLSAGPIVHRDLKPANILVRLAANGGYELKIADFGIGAVAAGQAIRNSTCRSSSTALRATAVQGSYTPLYASPEQRKGKPPATQDDVFSLGVIWYQLLTGDLQAEAPTGSRWRQRLLDRGMGPALVELLSSCFEPAMDRPADAALLAESLAPLVRGTAARSSPGPATARPVELQGAPVATAEEAGTARQSVHLLFRGAWYSRPRNGSVPDWTRVAALPATVALVRGQEYRLDATDVVDDDQLAGLPGLTALRELSLWSCEKATDAGLARLETLTTLHKLDLWRCPGITDAGLAHLQGLIALRKLGLSSCKQVTDAGLAHLRKLTRLQELSLVECDGLSDAGLAHLRSLTALQRLDLWRCQGVTDTGLAQLRSLTALQTLSLLGCKHISDAGLTRLRGLTALHKVYLGGCDQVTSVGAAALQRFLPRCYVER